MVSSSLGNPTVLYRIALLSGAVPLVAGLGILGAFAATERTWWIGAGLFCLTVGAAAFFVGVGALIARHVILRRREQTRFPWLPAALLLAAWPVAALCVAAGGALATRYVVVVQNNSPGALQDVRLTGGGCNGQIGQNPPGELRRISLWFSSDDELRLQFQRNGESQTVLVDDYVTGSMSGKVTAVIEQDGTVAMRNKSAPITDDGK
ncbi:MAG: hypothetical protein KDA44_22940 [Planctomycetales bacterium]|nr:hypothetical protein [Planctomycetales bacterium]